MRAFVLRQPGQPLSPEQLPDPEPHAGEVLVEVAACGVCHSDLHVMNGDIAFPTPAVMGHEISGTVVRVGPGVATVRPGDRVVSAFIMPCGACENCWRGHEELCNTFFTLNRQRGQLYDGTSRLRDEHGAIAQYSQAGHAELAVIPVTDVFTLPDSLPLPDAAVLGCAVFTAYGAIKHVAELEFGQSVAVIGTGGVGSALIQLAAAMGAAQVIAIDIAADKLAAAARLGATDTIDSRAQDAAVRVAELTGGRGVDIAFEAVGLGATIRQATHLVREGGRVVLVGLAAVGATAEIEITPVVRRKVQILGSFGARPRTDMPAIIDLVARGLVDIESTITRRFRFDELPSAYQALAEGSIVGRAIIDFTR